MSRFRNTATNVVVSVDDSKDDRFGEGWEALTESRPTEAKKTGRARRSTEADDNK